MRRYSHNKPGFLSFRVLIVALMFLSPSTAKSEPAAKEEVLSKLKHLVGDIKSISADVKVQSHYRNSNEPEVEQYKIYVKGQSKVRREWSKDKKRRTLEVIDKNTSWEVKDRRTVKRIELSSNSLNRIPLLRVAMPFPLLGESAVGTVSQLTTGNLKKMKYLGVEDIDGTLCWHFESRNQSFWVNSNDGSIKKSIGNKLGSPIISHFYENVRVNSKLDDHLFTYEPPLHTEVAEITLKDGKRRTRRYTVGDEKKETVSKQSSPSVATLLLQKLITSASSGIDSENATLLGDFPQTSPAYYVSNALITAPNCNKAMADQGNGKIAIYEVGKKPLIFPEFGKYAKILDAKLSANGNDYAFAVEAENWDQFVVVNGKPEQPFTEIKFNSLTVSPSGSYSYIGINKRGGKKKEQVIFNAALHDGYFAVHDLALSQDGTAVGYGAMEAVAEHYAVLNGKPLKRFAWVESAVLGKSASQFAYVVGEQFRSPNRSVVVGDSVGPPYKAISGLGFKAESKEVFYAAYTDTNYYIHFGQKKWGPYARPDNHTFIKPIIDKKGERISYVVTDGAGMFWIEENGIQLGKKYKSIQNIGYHPKTSEHIFLAADLGDNQWGNYIVTAGKETAFSPTYNDSWQKVISPNKPKLAFKMFNDAPLGRAFFGAVVLTFDGDIRLVGQYANLSEVQLSSDGKSFCFVAIVADKLYRISEKF